MKLFPIQLFSMERVPGYSKNQEECTGALLTSPFYVCLNQKETYILYFSEFYISE